MGERDVRLAIVNEFVAQFNEIGPRVTLDSVCKPIHISKKTIYKYFPSKTGIYDYILNEAAQNVIDEQHRVFEDPNLSTREKLIQILTIRTEWETKIDISKIFQFEASDPEFYAKFLAAYESNWQYFLALVEQGKNEGVVRQDVNGELMVSLLSSAMVSLYRGDTLRRLGIGYGDSIDQIAKSVLFGILEN